MTMGYIKGYDNYIHSIKSVNENFITDFINKITTDLKNKASLKLSKMFGTAKEVDKLFSDFEEKIKKSEADKFNLIKSYLNYQEQLSAGADKNESKEVNLLNNINRARKAYSDMVNNDMKILDTKVKNIIKTEKNEHIKDYVELKKLELQQSILSDELNLLNNEITDAMIKNNPNIRKDLNVDELEKRYEESNNSEKELISNLQNKNNSFDIEEAKKNDNYLWKSKYIKDYKFAEGDEILFFSKSDNKKEGDKYTGTIGYISSDEQQKKSNMDLPLTNEQIWITKDKNNLNSGFVINKGKIINVKKES